MNRTPRTRLVTLMAAAAGVTAGLGAMSVPARAMSHTPVTTLAADTLPKSKAPAAKPKTGAAPAKSATAAKKPGAAPAKTAAKPATAKPVVNTAGPNAQSENDACGSEEDCRNANGNGAGY